MKPSSIYLHKLKNNDFVKGDKIFLRVDNQFKFKPVTCKTDLTEYEKIKEAGRAIEELCKSLNKLKENSYDKPKSKYHK